MIQMTILQIQESSGKPDARARREVDHPDSIAKWFLLTASRQMLRLERERHGQYDANNDHIIL